MKPSKDGGYLSWKRCLGGMNKDVIPDIVIQGDVWLYPSLLCDLKVWIKFLCRWNVIVFILRPD